MKKKFDLKQIILTGGITEAQYQGLRKTIRKDNRILVRRFSLLAIISLLVLFIVSLFNNGLSDFKFVYLAFACISIIVWFVSRFSNEDNGDVSLANMYLFECVLLSLGVVLGTYLEPNEISAAYIAFMLAVPQLFTDRPYRIIILVAFFTAFFILIAVNVKDPSTLTSDITNAISFGVLSIILATYSISTRMHRFHLEKEISYMATNDVLTGLKNRRSYENSIKRIDKENYDSAYCIYIDADGLHELNNAKGHEEGDRMLKQISLYLTSQFGEDNVYRVGGDEFVVLGTNHEPETINNRVESFMKAMGETSYHVSMGLSYIDNHNEPIGTIVKEAEKAMYENKSAYYRSEGGNRRRR